MRKETRKEFVVCKDYTDKYCTLNKGDIVLIHPVEFYDSCGGIRAFVADCDMDPGMTVDVIFLTPDNFKEMLTADTWEEKYSTLVNIYDLPLMFNDLKIQPRNITVEFDE